MPVFEMCDENILRLRFEIPPRNSAPQIHNQNSVLNPATEFYTHFGGIPKFRSMQACPDEILKF
nr:hypothetical protein [uncultured Campylobacter sp.]